MYIGVASEAFKFLQLFLIAKKKTGISIDSGWSQYFFEPKTQISFFQKISHVSP